MVKVHNLLVIYRKINNKIFKLIGQTHYFETKYGVKAYNKPPFLFSSKENREIISVQPDSVLLSFDGLKDEYTHIDTPLSASPHLGLVKAIQDDTNIRETVYFQQEILGCLDGRFELPDTQKVISHHLLCSKKKTGAMPVIYILNDKKYVLDGKHRLATAILKNQESVECVLLPILEVSQYVYAQDILHRMRKSPSLYKKNIEHLEQLLKW